MSPLAATPATSHFDEAEFDTSTDLWAHDHRCGEKCNDGCKFDYVYFEQPWEEYYRDAQLEMQQFDWLEHDTDLGDFI